MNEAMQIMTVHEDTAARAGLPGTLPGALARSRVELRSFFRNWQSLVFTMALPVLMLLVFGAVFTGKLPGTDTDYRLLFVSGIIAAGVMSTSFQSLAISVSLDRENGLIRRLAASPMPKAAYFIGITVKTIVTTLIETAILVVLGMVLYGLPMPSDAGRWLTFAWVVLLGLLGRYCVHGADSQRQVRSGHRHAPVHDSPVHLRGVLPSHDDPDRPAVHGQCLPPAVDGQGLALRVPARLTGVG